MRHSAHLLRTIQPTVAEISGLVGRWDLDESTGNNAADKSGYGKTLSCTAAGNPCSSYSPLVWTAPGHGMSSNCFTPNQQYGPMLSNLSWAQLGANGPATFSAWVKPSTSGNNPCFLDCGNQRCTIGTNNSGQISAMAGATKYSGVNIHSDWNHIVFIMPAGGNPVNCYFYIDNVYQYGSNSGTSAFNMIYPEIRIGTDGGAKAWKGGSISNVRIYNRVLTAAEVNTLYTTT